MASSELHKQRRARNYALAGVLVALVVLFFFIAMVKFRSGG